MPSGELGRRLAVAAVGIPVVLGLAWLGGWALGVLVAVAAALAVFEFYDLARLRGERPFTAWGVAATVAVVIVATAWPDPWEAAPAAGLVLMATVLLALTGSIWLRWPGGSPMASVSVTAAGVVYVGFTLAFIPVLRALPEAAPEAFEGGGARETAFLMLPFLATWVGDTAAYTAGRAWGSTRLAPSASPGKTVTGAVAGLVGSSVAAVAVSAWALDGLPALEVPLSTAAWMGLVLGAVGQLGDLAESVLKREAGVKDSGRILPGHGGVLDRVDALLFAVPVTWLLLLGAGIVGGPVP